MVSATVSRVFPFSRSALSAITTVFNTRLFLFKEAVAALAGMEELLLRCLRRIISAEGVLDAVSAAVARSGFNMFSAIGSTLFSEALRVSSFRTLVSGLEFDRREVAVQYRNLC